MKAAYSVFPANEEYWAFDRKMAVLILAAGEAAA